MKTYFKLNDGDVRQIVLLSNEGERDSFGKKSHEWRLREGNTEYYWTPSPAADAECMFYLTNLPAKVIVDKKKMPNGFSKIRVLPDNNNGAIPQATPPKEQRIVPMNEPDYSLDPQAQGAPNWDKIALGKCRTLFAVEAFKTGKPLTQELIDSIEQWAKYCLTGTL